MRDFVLAVGLAFLAAIALLLLRGADAPVVPGSAPSASRTGSMAVPAQAQQAAAAPVAAPEPAASAAASLWLLPDGTRVPMLNGATGAPPLAEYWGSSVPWSPIVGIERNDQGLDWYRHANGSYSTTQMVWRSDLGRNLAMTRVAHPAPVGAPPAAAPTNR